MKTVKITKNNVQQLIGIANYIDLVKFGMFTTEWDEHCIESSVGDYFQYDDKKKSQWQTIEKSNYEAAKAVRKAEREAKKITKLLNKK